MQPSISVETKTLERRLFTPFLKKYVLWNFIRYQIWMLFKGWCNYLYWQCGEVNEVWSGQKFQRDFPISEQASLHLIAISPSISWNSNWFLTSWNIFQDYVAIFQPQPFTKQSFLIQLVLEVLQAIVKKFCKVGQNVLSNLPKVTSCILQSCILH